MAGRSSLLLVLGVLALAAVAYFAFGGPRGEQAAPTGDESLDVGAAQRAADADAPPAEPMRPDGMPLQATPETTTPRSPEIEDAAPGVGEVEPAGPVRPPADGADTQAYRRPELVDMGVVSWNDAAAMHVVESIMRETGLRLEASKAALEVLDRARVTLNLEGKKASYVLGMVLLPHSLGFTVRDDRLIVFVEDD